MFLNNSLKSLNRIGYRFNNLKNTSSVYTNFRRLSSSSKTQNQQDFCSQPFESKLFKDYAEFSVNSYKSSKDSVDSEMTHLLATHKLLLFMEGSVDAPKSLCAGNIVKMFTLLQVLNFHTLDVLSNPPVFGFLCSKFGEPVRNILFKDGVPFAGHDELLELFKRGKLLQALEVPKTTYKTTTPKEFANHLPIANY
ncbi:hypothetical protein TpMuguga_01g01047 [Theileria parva strain Muguga]|uniref:Uncharacterized protein n=1 Tax=Theileria parva TaxID=5875 RepID=Q4N6X3_THEPA|nr:uncharacterized protein TpMuguga_01g01047 [Theileria parva strain Muguga]EAN34285.1 hypothetical protein TpMuguga_01g01047 [Theileria parva strain Muguga]|eukprot:XP_766568.1 hypothetical protein [Theileria parva strain Muguga]